MSDILHISHIEQRIFTMRGIWAVSQYEIASYLAMTMDILSFRVACKVRIRQHFVAQIPSGQYLRRSKRSWEDVMNTQFRAEFEAKLQEEPRLNALIAESLGV